MSIDYSEDDFPEEFDLQHEGVEETNPYLTMSADDFRLHIVTMLEQGFNNQHAIHDATDKAFELMEKRLQEFEWKLQALQKKEYGQKH